MLLFISVIFKQINGAEMKRWRKKIRKKTGEDITLSEAEIIDFFNKQDEMNAKKKEDSIQSTGVFLKYPTTKIDAPLLSRFKKIYEPWYFG